MACFISISLLVPACSESSLARRAMLAASALAMFSVMVVWTAAIWAFLSRAGAGAASGVAVTVTLGAAAAAGVGSATIGVAGAGVAMGSGAGAGVGVVATGAEGAGEATTL